MDDFRGRATEIYVQPSPPATVNNVPKPSRSGSGVRIGFGLKRVHGSHSCMHHMHSPVAVTCAVPIKVYDLGLLPWRGWTGLGTANISRASFQDRDLPIYAGPAMVRRTIFRFFLSRTASPTRVARRGGLWGHPIRETPRKNRPPETAGMPVCRVPERAGGRCAEAPYWST